MPCPLLTGWPAAARAATALARTGRAPAGLALAGLALASLALAGLAAAGGPASAATAQPGGAPPVSVAITSVNPAWARPGKPVTVSGTLTNTSGRPMPGLSVQILSSSSRFSSRALMQEYLDGSYLADSAVPGAVINFTRPVAARATVNWSIVLPPSQLGMTEFGVYPLAAQADNSSQSPLTVNETFLPFWPGNKDLDPEQQQIAWIWPLIDQPRQALCAGGLADNGLAASLAQGGRLSGLLEAGSQYADGAHLTWAVDPALLANARTMTKPYWVGSIGCTGKQQPASHAAAAWLAQLETATAGQPVFVTPYSDVDIAALTKYDLNSDLSRAFSVGRSVAGTILGRDFNPAATTAASTSLGGMAWPADGIANYSVLENLAASDGINTVVLDSSTMPPSPQQDFTPTAQTTTPDGEGPDLKVLLSDDTITQILGSANSPADSKATAFAVAQRYLAETAMIAAEQPNLARSIVVAPPRSWDPPAGLASDLLSETVSAPWLQPVSLGDLAAVKHPAGQVTRQAPATVSQAELGRTMLTQVHELDEQVKVMQGIQLGPDPALADGVAAVESAAWRGGGAAGGRGAALLQQFSRYLSGQERLLTVIGPRRVTLAGLKGPVPISISNRLSYPVRVRLQVGPSNGITVRNQPPPMVVPAGQQQIKKVEIAVSNVGSTTLRFSLLTPQGAPFPAQATVIVQATHYGTLALVIIGSALAVFVLTSATRAFRRGRRARRGQPDDPGAGAAPGTPDEVAAAPNARSGAPDPVRGPRDATAGERGWHDDQREADNVGAEGPSTGHATTPASDQQAAEEADDFAWAPGWADPR